jgi:hypothetical protein
VLSPTVKFQNLPEPDIALAERLFEILATDGIGVPRCAKWPAAPDTTPRSFPEPAFRR